MRQSWGLWCVSLLAACAVVIMGLPGEALASKGAGAGVAFSILVMVELITCLVQVLVMAIRVAEPGPTLRKVERAMAVCNVTLGTLVALDLLVRQGMWRSGDSAMVALFFGIGVALFGGWGLWRTRGAAHAE